MIAKELFAIEMQKLMDDLEIRIPQERLIRYFKRLNEEFDNKSFLRAVNRLRDEWQPYGREYPSVAEFLRAGRMSDEEIEEIANIAYQSAKDTAIKNSCYVTPEFEDALIADVIDLLGGWIKFQNGVAYIDSDDTFLRKDFIRLYKNKARNKSLRRVKLHGQDFMISGKDRKIEVKAPYKVLFSSKECENVLENSKTNEIVGNLVQKVKMGA